MSHDICWLQRFANYTKSMQSLSEAMTLAGERPLSRLEQQGLIQAPAFAALRREPGPARRCQHGPECRHAPANRHHTGAISPGGKGRALRFALDDLMLPYEIGLPNWSPILTGLTGLIGRFTREDEPLRLVCRRSFRRVQKSIDNSYPNLYTMTVKSIYTTDQFDMWFGALCDK